MSRKNSKVGRSKDRGRRALTAQRERGLSPNRTVQPNIEKMITPDGKCFFHSRFGKDIFLTETKAAKALKQVQTQRLRSGTGHVEKRFYACPKGGCGGFHLTSRETYEERGES